MAQLVPGFIGLLTAFAVWAILPKRPAGPRRPHRPADVLRAALVRLRGRIRMISELIGARLPEAALRSAPVAAAAREAGRLLHRAAGAPGPHLRADAGMLALLVATGSLAGAVASLSAIGAPIGGGVVFAALAGRAMRRARSEARALASAMPEAFGALAIALGSGHSLSQGMRFVGSHADEPIRSEFLRASLCMECGVSAAAALDSLLERLPAPGLDLVALALKVSQRTGAPLRVLLAEASEMVGERIELVRRLDVRTAQARMSARMVALMPLAMICLLSLLSRDFRRGLLTGAGTVSVLLALSLNALAWLIIRRIMQVRI